MKYLIGSTAKCLEEIPIAPMKLLEAVEGFKKSQPIQWSSVSSLMRDIALKLQLEGEIVAYHKGIYLIRISKQLVLMQEEEIHAPLAVTKGFLDWINI